MSCSKSIVECLRDKGIYPVAFASNEETTNKATNALDYEINSMFYTYTSVPQKWTVDFTQTVTILKYNTKSYKSCNYIKKWNTYISEDNLNWKIIDSPTAGFVDNNNFTLANQATGRFFKIEGLYDECGYSFAFHHVKFFGTLMKNKAIKCTCIMKRSVNYNILRFVILLCS